MSVRNRVRLRAMVTTDAEVIFKFYEEGIQTGHAPFEAEVPDWHKWDSRHLTQWRWLAEEEHTVLGWGVLTQGSPGKVYLGVAEVSIYVSGTAQNQDIGSILLERLISSSEESNFWTLQAQVFPENKIIIHASEKHGFKKSDTPRQLAPMFFGSMAGEWRDPVLMERRSKIAGI